VGRKCWAMVYGISMGSVWVDLIKLLCGTKCLRIMGEEVTNSGSLLTDQFRAGV
jgi:hypothetical protein